MASREKQVVFKFHGFPTMSETFITGNIIAAIRAGYDVKLLVNQVNSMSQASQPDLIEHYGLMGRIVRLHPPRGLFPRIKRFLELILNGRRFGRYLRYTMLSSKLSVANLYWLHFYEQFEQTEVFHVHFEPNLYPLLIMKRLGVIRGRILLTFHGYDAHAVLTQKGPNYLTSFKRYIDGVSVNSNYLKQVLIAQGFDESMIRVIPMGVETDYFRSSMPPTPNQPFKLLSVGRLIPLKGHAYGLQVLRILLDRGLAVEYSIVGSGRELNKLKGQAAELRVQRAAHFLGSRTQHEIRELLSEHQLLLMTSVFDGERREAFGVVSLEAQSMLLPVVAFDSGGVRDTFKDGYSGYLVPEFDVQAMADKIQLLANNPDLYSDLSKNARRHVVENLDLELTNRAYLKWYQTENQD